MLLSGIRILRVVAAVIETQIKTHVCRGVAGGLYSKPQYQRIIASNRLDYRGKITAFIIEIVKGNGAAGNIGVPDCPDCRGSRRLVGSQASFGSTGVVSDSRGERDSQVNGIGIHGPGIFQNNGQLGAVVARIDIAGIHSNREVGQVRPPGFGAHLGNGRSG